MKYAEFLVEACGFYELLIAAIEEGTSVNPAPDQKCSITLAQLHTNRGDLWRYLELETGNNEFILCIRAYHEAWICSDCTDGLPLNQLSVVYGYQNDSFNSLLFGFKSLAAKKSCPLAFQNVQSVLRMWDSTKQTLPELQHKIVCMLVSGKREYLLNWNEIDSKDLLIDAFTLIVGFCLFVLRQQPQAPSSCSLLARPILAQLKVTIGGISELQRSISHFPAIEEWTKLQLNF